MTTTTSQTPAFVKVMAILTFVGSGLFLLFGLYTVFTIDAQIESMNKAVSALNELGISMDMDLEYKASLLSRNGVVPGLLTTVGSMLCIVGAVLMLKVKRSGLYLYLLGQLTAMVPMLLLWELNIWNGVLGIGCFSVFIVLNGLNWNKLN